jgi:hypothetical protein
MALRPPFLPNGPFEAKPAQPEPKYIDLASGKARVPGMKSEGASLPSLVWSSVLILCLSGCEGMRDVSKDPGYHGDYHIGAVYKVKTLLFVHRDGVVWRPDFGGTPPSLEAFRSNKIGTWSDVAGPLLPGTRMKLESIWVEKFGGDVGRIVHVYALVLDGELTGTKVELTFISEGEYSRSLGVSVPLVPESLLEKQD